MYNYKHIASVLFCGVILLALPCCTCTSVPEARQTIAVADSLRVNEGRLYDDSLALAEAYTTFGRRKFVYPNDYARACYYYGYLLRQRGDQVAAMQAFIAGTHAPYIQRVIPLPWFSDYHILGRIYSNMGTMCHLGDEFELSYAMYEHSAEAFHKAGDTTLYYYILNDMALELAEQKLHNETLALLDNIAQECLDSGVMAKLWETRAILYNNLTQYDSAIYAAKQLYEFDYPAVTGYVVMAQAFWSLGQHDSAVYYARQVMNKSNVSPKEEYNMLYILAYNDSIADDNEKLRRSEQRSDVDKKILDPLHVQLQQAIDLLLHDLNKKPYYLNLGLILLSLFTISIVTCIARIRLGQKHKKLYEEISLKKRQEAETIVQNIEYQCNLWRNEGMNLRNTLALDDYQNFSAIVNANCYGLVDKLNNIAKLSQTETKLCVLVFVGLDTAQIQKLLPYSANGYGKLKYTASRKIGTTAKDMRVFMLKLLTI